MATDCSVYTAVEGADHRQVREVVDDIEAAVALVQAEKVV